MPERESRASLLCLVFTDLVDSTALKSRLGDAAAGELLATHHDEVLRLAKLCGGREIDSAGDGSFLTFEAPSAALRFALSLQLFHSERPELPDVRIGLHLGEVSERAAPAGSAKTTLVEGLAVDLAARIAAAAGPRQVLMSKPVFDAARQRTDEDAFGRPVSWRAHGAYLVKGSDDEIELGEAGYEGFSPLAPPADSDKARRARQEGDDRTLGWRPAVGLTIPGRPHWQLTQALGAGAIGEVWLATHEATGAKRVFKFCFQEESVRSLKREVALLGLLKESLGERPDIAQVIDWEFDSPPYFLETHHSEAGDLVEWAREQGGIDKVPLETRIDIVCQIADALTAAHGAGVLHKDLKPANVLIHEDADGRPRVCLTDFGIGLVTNPQMLEVPGITALGLTDALLSDGVATGAGTRLYMAPEVMEGRQATELSDLYSLGVILYQVAAQDFGRALAPGWERDVPDSFVREDIAASVDHDPEQRLPSAAALAERLRELERRRRSTRVAGTRRRTLRVAIAAGLMLLLGAAGFRAYEFYSAVRWARDVAQPQIRERLETNDFAGAFALASRVEETLGANPALDPVWAIIAGHVSFETEPSGATVSYRPYDDPDGSWTTLGTTPITDVRVPRGASVWRIEKAGYATRQLARLPPADATAAVFPWPSRYVLEPLEDAPGIDVVKLEPWSYAQVSLGGFPQGLAYELAGFDIDRTEVRNDAYQEFVDAGGYQRPEFWLEPFVKEGRPLELAEAMDAFRDSTGRPGPSTWVAGRFPEGLGAYPVAGVSWFEAMAYARFRGRSLPTVYHWVAAALPDSEIVDPLAPVLAAQSRLGESTPVAAGSTTGISAAGAADMFGNVAEWVSTAAGADKRFVLGSGYSDPDYHAPQMAFASPWSRLPTHGLRLATYSEAELDPALTASIEVPSLDYRNLELLSDDAIAMLASLSRYSPAPLNARREVVDIPGVEKVERITVDAPYGDGELPIFLLRPEGVKPPYQAVVWFGGMNAVMTQDNQTLYGVDMGFANFLRQSGRLVVMPLWTGTFERNDGSTFTHFRRGQLSVLTMTWSKDLRRTLDFLESNDEVDADRIAFVGLSLGAAIGGRMVGGEERLETAIFWSGGFAASQDLESSIQTASFVTRTTLPVLMLNGRHDFVFPYEPHQRAYYEMLGTPPEHKRHVVWDEAGHFGFPLGEFVRENLDWLDRYLGPVTRGG